MNANTTKVRLRAIPLTVAAALVLAMTSFLLTPSSAQTSAAVPAVASADQATQPPTNRQLGRLVGQWRMTSLQVRTGNGFERVPYSGQIIFTRAGTMTVQAMNPDPDAPDTAYTVNGYEAFYGTVEVNRDAGRFVVEVESSVVRDLIGQRLPRNFEVSRDRLVLTPVDPAEGWRVTYERVR